MSSYEAHCNDYALHGDPERDHYDHEENARHDRFDGWGDPDPCDEVLDDAELAALEDLDELDDYVELDDLEDELDHADIPF